LKTLQRWLLANVIKTWPVHECSYAYIRERGIKANARRHVDSRYLLRVDIEDFFPSIKDLDLRTYLAGRPPGTADWDEDDIQFFINVVSRSGVLTIGAPTSPSLSNVICWSLDASLEALAAEHGATYTRYADDLFFSTVRANVLGSFPMLIAEILSQLPYPTGLRLNRDKTRHSSKRGLRRVTGLVLGSDGRVSLGRGRKRFIRRQIHKLETLTPTDRQRLAGLIAFAMDVEPDIVNSLVLKYGPRRVASARNPSLQLHRGDENN
jgi:RNA-directed DNA polymerase